MAKPPFEPRAGLDLAADDCDPLPDPEEAVPRPRSGGRPPRPSSTTSISTPSGEKRTRDVRDRRARVLEHVRQCLLHDPVAGDVHPGWDAVRLVPRSRARRAGPRRASPLRVPRAARATAAGHRDLLVVVAQHPEQPAHLAERLLTRALDRVEGRTCRLGIALEHLPAATGLDHDDRDRVRDDVVQLACDPLPLLRHRGAGLLVLVALELDGAERQRALALPPQPDHHACKPGAAEDERAEDDVPDVEGVAVVGDERCHGQRNEEDRGPRLPSSSHWRQTSTARRRSRRRAPSNCG